MHQDLEWKLIAAYMAWNALNSRNYGEAQNLLSFSCGRPVLGLLAPCIAQERITGKHRWKIHHRARVSIVRTIRYLERKAHEQSTPVRAVCAPVHGVQAGQTSHQVVAGAATLAKHHRGLLRLSSRRPVLVRSD